MMPAPGEGHDKKPGRKRQPGFGVGNVRPLAKINLRGFAWGKIQDDRGLNIVFFKPQEKTPYRRVTTAKPIVSRQGLVNRCPLYAFLRPSGTLIPVRINRRNSSCTTMFDIKNLGNDRLIGNRSDLVQLAGLQGDSPKLSSLLTTHKAALGNWTVGLTRPHVNYNLTYLIHLEPPIGHGEHPPHLKFIGEVSTPFLRDPKPNYKIRLAPLGDHGLAPYGRSVTCQHHMHRHQRIRSICAVDR